jgi:hypothetical protein
MSARKSYVRMLPGIVTDVLRELHFDRGIPLEELANEIGLRERSLRSIFQKIGFYRGSWTEAEIYKLHAKYLAGSFASELAKSRHRSSEELLAAFRRLNLEILDRKKPVMPRRVDDEVVRSMHADYMALGLSLSESARRYGRHPQTARELFISRGLPLRESAGYQASHREDGTFVAYPLKTPEEIEALIQAAVKIAVPVELKLEWRRWSLERRGDFLRRLRARLPDPKGRPDLPFSDNVEPFDYASESAWEIVRQLNAGLSSRDWRSKIDIRSQGVIYRNQLWFWWAHSGGYFRMGGWTKENGRPSLHRTIWEETIGQPIPNGYAVSMIDGNPNNLDPSNFYLRSLNEVCRENQAKSLVRKSREKTRILLERSQKTSQSHDLIKHLSES